jgi:glycerol-3-phosphate dehydrogenase
MKSRAHRIQHLRENPEISVLIVGAGINGIGTFLDLALQGVEVLLVDRDDYCSGASAASSHMVHGGIRYLEYGEFRLVREAVQERNRLIENAPHLVKPLATTIPIFKTFSGLLNAPLNFLRLLNRPAERGALVIKFGMALYDFFTRKQKTVPRHQFKNKEESLKRYPALNPDIIFTGTYYDGTMPSPERIALELIADATGSGEQAIPLNYVSLISASGKNAVLMDEITGEILEICPQVVVNAGGPWIDQINRSMGTETCYIGGTKGSHLVLDHPELREAIEENEFFFENQDGRIVLIFPLEDRVLIGTSDIQIDDPDQAVVTHEEVAYFFEMIKVVFPGIDVDESHIVFTFSGVRPLTNTRARFTGQISRDHEIEITEPGEAFHFPVYSLIGGKWTTYRAFSEQTSDLVLKRLNRPRLRSTRDLKIGGSKGYPRDQEEKEALISRTLEKHQTSRERIELLLDRYGHSGLEFLNGYEAEVDRPLNHYPDYTVAEIERLVGEQDVIHLDDFILRRTLIGTLGRVTRDGLEEIALVIGRTLGWRKERSDEEVARVIELLRTRHGMDFNQYVGVQGSTVEIKK